MMKPAKRRKLRIILQRPNISTGDFVRDKSE